MVLMPDNCTVSDASGQSIVCVVHRCFPFLASWRRQWVIPFGVSKPSRDKRHEAFASPEQINLILRNR